MPAPRTNTYDSTMRRMLNVSTHSAFNPLGVDFNDDQLLHEHHLLIRMAMISIDHEMAISMRDHLQAMHADGDSDGLPGMKGDLDVVTARLAAHAGLVPLSLAWMARAGDGLEVDVDGALGLEIDIHAHPDDPDCTTMIRIEHDAHWFTAGALAVPALPDTICSAVVGRPLADVYAHPVLDPSGFVVKRVAPVRIRDDVDGTILILDAPRIVATPDDLFAIYEEMQ